MQQFQKMIYGSINSTKIGSDLFDVAHIYLDPHTRFDI